MTAFAPDTADADLDKDGRISVWEAFAFASAQTARYYEQRGQLPVEKALLDDTGTVPVETCSRRARMACSRAARFSIPTR